MWSSSRMSCRANYLSSLNTSVGCRISNFSLTVFSPFQKVRCDDLQDWWCVPWALQNFQNISVTWEGAMNHGPDTQELWIVSPSATTGSQTCASPVIATTTQQPSKCDKRIAIYKKDVL